jgi:lantibiotic biosynthesis protein
MSSRPTVADLVGVLAERLADPAAVRATVVASVGERSWQPASLVEGYAGIALLFASLPGRNNRALAHAHLAAAVRERVDAGRGALYTGDLALGFAAAVAARSTEDYLALRRSVRRIADRALAWHDERRPFHYDTISGLTGLGRHLLAEGQHEPLRQVLDRLVALTEPITLHGRRVPGWWVHRPPTDVDDPKTYARGHVNLGMAHGIAGPLALLSLARSAGVVVPGHEEAIARIVAWQLERVLADEHGPYWPYHLTFAEETGGTTVTAAKPAWCYGTPGVARAVQLAGLAMGEASWGRVAVRAMRSALERPREHVDGSLCHGSAGLLHVTAAIAADSGEPSLLAALPRLVGETAARFDPAAPFGFRYTDAALALTEDRAGFLEGAAGIALALAAATGMSTSDGMAPWDAALLVH